MMDACLKLANMVDGKVNCLVDLNSAGKPSVEARKVGMEGFRNKKFGKIALIGSHPVAKVLAFFVMGVIKKKDMRFFKTKEEALKWLKKGS